MNVTQVKDLYTEGVRVVQNLCIPDPDVLKLCVSTLTGEIKIEKSLYYKST